MGDGCRDSQTKWCMGSDLQKWCRKSPSYSTRTNKGGGIVWIQLKKRNKEKNFVHFYSDIFSVLTQVKQNPELGDINILGQNLDVIRNGYQSKNKAEDGHTIDVSDAINKLYDHVNLDIARMLYTDAGD